MDAFFAIRGPIAATTPIIVVLINDETLRVLGTQWPPPRAAYAKLLERLQESPPVAIGFDLLFTFPSAYGVRDDEEFSAGVARIGRVVLASAVTERSSGPYTKIEHEIPWSLFRRGVVAVGQATLAFDQHGVVRRMTLVRTVGGTPVPAFDVELARLAEGRRRDFEPRTDLDGALINFRGSFSAFRHFTYQEILDGSVSPELWRNKVVLVGQHVARQGDRYKTSFSRHELMPGVFIHANVVDGLLNTGGLKELAFMSRLALAVCCVGLGLLLASFSGRAQSVVIATVVLASSVGSYVGFSRLGWWIAPALPILGFVLGVVAGSIAAQIGRRHQRIKRQGL